MILERYPNLKEEVGDLNPGCEIFSLPDGKLVKWSNASCALALACLPLVSKKKEKRKKSKRRRCKHVTVGLRNTWIWTDYLHSKSPRTVD
jgi:hypothetical protein